MLKDTAFYDSESGRYSEKRYPAVARSYIQSVYAERLKLVHALIRRFAAGGRFLEIGCADGVVTRSVYDAYGDTFSEYHGVDVSPRMIEAANALKGERNIAFSLRSGHFAGQYGLVLEVGVLNYTDPAAELRDVRSLLADDGVYICSIAGLESLWHRLKPSEEKGFKSFESYRTYESEIKKHFRIEAAIGVGLFIPHLWKVPAVARILQPLCERALRNIAPNLFQEKVYVLRPLV